MAKARIDIGASISGAGETAAGLNKIAKELENVAKAGAKVKAMGKVLGPSAPVQPEKITTGKEKTLGISSSSDVLKQIDRAIKTYLDKEVKVIQKWEKEKLGAKGVPYPEKPPVKDVIFRTMGKEEWTNLQKHGEKTGEFWTSNIAEYGRGIIDSWGKSGEKVLVAAKVDPTDAHRVYAKQGDMEGNFQKIIRKRFEDIIAAYQWTGKKVEPIYKKEIIKKPEVPVSTIPVQPEEVLPKAKPMPSPAYRAQMQKLEVLGAMRDEAIAPSGTLAKQLGITQKQVITLDVDTKKGQDKIEYLFQEIKKLTKKATVEVTPRVSTAEKSKLIEDLHKAKQGIPPNLLSLDMQLTDKDLAKKSKADLKSIVLETNNLRRRIERETPPPVVIDTKQPKIDAESISRYEKDMQLAGYQKVEIEKRVAEARKLSGDELRDHLKIENQNVSAVKRKHGMIRSITVALEANKTLATEIEKKTGIRIPPPVPPVPGAPAGAGDADKWRAMHLLEEKDLKRIQDAISLHNKMQGATYRNRLEQDRIARTVQRFGTVTLAAYGALIREAVKFNISLVELTSAYRLTNTQAMQLSGLAETTGVNIEKLVIGIGNYYQKILTAGMGTSLVAERVREALLKVGIASVRLGQYGMGAVEMLDQMRRAFRELKNPQDKAYLGNMVFGGQFKDFLPLLEMGDEAFARIITRFEMFAQFTSAKGRQTIMDLNAEIRALTFSFRFMGQTLMQSLKAQLEWLAYKTETLLKLFTGLPRGVKSAGVAFTAFLAIGSVLGGQLLIMQNVLGRISEAWGRYSVGIGKATKLTQAFNLSLLGTKAVLTAIVALLVIVGYDLWKSNQEQKDLNNTLIKSSRVYGVQTKNTLNRVKALAEEKEGILAITEADKAVAKQIGETSKELEKSFKKRAKLEKEVSDRRPIAAKGGVRGIPVIGYFVDKRATEKSRRELEVVNKEIQRLAGNLEAYWDQFGKAPSDVLALYMTEKFNEFDMIMNNSSANIRDRVREMKAAFKGWSEFQAETGISIEQEIKKFADEMEKAVFDTIKSIKELHKELKDNPFEAPDASDYIKKLQSIRKGTVKEIKKQQEQYDAMKEIFPDMIKYAEVEVAGLRRGLQGADERIAKDYSGVFKVSANEISTWYGKSLDDVSKIINNLPTVDGIVLNEEELSSQRNALYDVFSTVTENKRKLKAAERKHSAYTRELSEADTKHASNMAEQIRRLERELHVYIRELEYETFKVKSELRQEFLNEARGFVDDMREIEKGLGIAPDISLSFEINENMIQDRREMAEEEIKKLRQSTENYIAEERKAIERDLTESGANKREITDALNKFEIEQRKKMGVDITKIQHDTDAKIYGDSLATIKQYASDSTLTHSERISALQGMLGKQEDLFNKQLISEKHIQQVRAQVSGNILNIENEYTRQTIELQNELLTSRVKFNREYYGTQLYGAANMYYNNLLKLADTYAKGDKKLTLEQQKSFVSMINDHYSQLLSVESIGEGDRMKILRDKANAMVQLNSKIKGDKTLLLIELQKVVDEMHKAERSILFTNPMERLKTVFSNFLTTSKDTLRNMKLEVFDGFIGMIDVFTTGMISRSMEMGKVLDEMFKSFAERAAKVRQQYRIEQTVSELTKQGVDAMTAYGIAMQYEFRRAGESSDKMQDDIRKGYDALYTPVPEKYINSLGDIYEKSKGISDYLGKALPTNVRIDFMGTEAGTALAEVMKMLQEQLNANPLQVQVVPNAGSLLGQKEQAYGAMMTPIRQGDVNYNINITNNVTGYDSRTTANVITQRTVEEIERMRNER
jgi:hypothetical protein